MGYWSDYQIRCEEQGYSPSDQAGCAKHVLDDSLLERLNDKFTEGDCSFCGAAGPGIAVPLDEVLAIGMEKVRFEFTPAAEYGAGLEALGFSYEGGHDTADALGEVFEDALDEPVIAGVRSCGGDQTWVPKAFLYLDEQERMAATWTDFVSTVKHRRRFWFSADNEAIYGADPEKLGVADFFASIANLLTRPEIAVPIPVGSIVVRGRMVHAEQDSATFDAKELGSPPDIHAAANRMSPRGVSMFYGGDSPEVVVAEIGAHSNYNHAIYGKFTTLRDLTVIDLTKLPPIPGYFTADPVERLLLRFLHDFVADLVKPIILDGREHIEYVPTQVVTEYLRYFTEPAVQGLRFASSQLLGGINTVLFCDADKCVNPAGDDLNQEGWPAPEVAEEMATKFPGQMPWLQLDPDTVVKVRTATTISVP